MDNALHFAWQNSSPPFDGVTVFDASEDEMQLPRLRRVVLAVARILEQSFPDSELFALDDWHEHDGFCVIAKRTDWSKLWKYCQSDKEFLYFKSDDFQVSRAVYPKSMQFYLRVCIEEESSAEKGLGTFDVTIPQPLVARVCETLVAAGVTPLTENAKSYFDRRYAG